MAELDWDDVQGTILRGYRVDLARHLVLKVDDAAAARALLGSLVSGEGSLPQVTTAARWRHKPACFLNVGITYEGLRALGVPEGSLASFPRSFRLGATDPLTAKVVGDVEASDPRYWIGGLSDGTDVHVVLSTWVAKDPAVLEEVTANLGAALAPAATVLSVHDARALPGDHVHFGYRDSIAQPLVAGAPPTKRSVPDGRPVVPAGAFLLGHPSQNAGSVYHVEPEALSTNSSFGAFRILEQDVAGFEAFLSDGAATLGIDRELLAAKVCGRWRNGVPLVLSPDTDAPDPPLDPAAHDDFDYVSDDPSTDDTFGYRCPLGAHIRRANPRSQAVLGGSGHLHRIIRRAMPYGPAYDPAAPDDATRGLIGFFINADLANQFELIMGTWMNGSTFVKSVPGPDGTNALRNISGDDVMGGRCDPSASSFTLPFPGTATAPPTNRRLTGFSRFVTTRGGAYCYLPSVTALRHLAGLAS